MWDGVGLDVEPDARIYLQILDGPWGLVPMLAPRLFDRARPARSRAAFFSTRVRLLTLAASARDTKRGLAGVAHVDSYLQSLGGEICLILRHRSALAGVSVRM